MAISVLRKFPAYYTHEKILNAMAKFKISEVETNTEMKHTSEKSFLKCKDFDSASVCVVKANITFGVIFQR